MTTNALKIDFDNTFARQMEGFYAAWQGEVAPSPAIRIFNFDLAKELALSPEELNSPEGAAVLSGGVAPAGSSPLAQVYAGHQFGGFSPQLGDGRALLLGEVIDRNGKRRDLQLKGSGRTPFSRMGDGKAALGPVLREYLIGEAMHALGIPTTRALSVVTTGEKIFRDAILPGAVLCRVASSHLRVGTFQFFAARGEEEQLQRLSDYAIARHYPQSVDAKHKYRAFFSAVMKKQAELVAKWMQVGFIHGVMNTDNVTISGETIDYGPCAFMDQYDPKTVFSSIDKDGRYAFANQPLIARWNLARFAEAILPLLDSETERDGIEFATGEINAFPGLYRDIWMKGMLSKLGIKTEQPEGAGLVNDLFAAIEGQGVDFTLFFRSLSDVLEEQPGAMLSLFANPEAISPWLERWQQRLTKDGVEPAKRKSEMDRVNPLYIPRNHLVEEALSAASHDNDFEPFEKLLSVVTEPFSQREGLEKYEQPAPDEFGNYKTFCGT